MGFNLITFGYGIPLICGCDTHSRRLRHPPQEYEALLEVTPTYYCPRCNRMQPGAVYRTSNYFTFFCIPLCPVSREEPYIGCLQCKRYVDARSASQVCPGCGTWRGEARFCPACGLPQRHFDETMFHNNPGKASDKTITDTKESTKTQ